jgi:hypothetical protein
VIRTFILLVVAAVLGACTGFEGVTETLNPNGPTSLKAYNYDLGALPRSSGQVGCTVGW